MGFALCRSKMMNGVVALHSPPMRKDAAEKNVTLFRSVGCVGSRELFTIKLGDPALLLRSNRSPLMLLRRRFFAFSSLWTGAEATRLIWRGALVDTGRERVVRFFFSDLRFRSRGYPTRSRSKIADMDGTDDEMDFSSAPSTPDSYESELEYVFDEIRIEKQMEMVRERLAAYYKPKEDEPKEVKKKEDEDDDDTQSESYEYEEGDDVLWEYFISDPKRRYKDF
ncbi:unnamed protein product [Cuscuta campestris]|uniref:Uncharacterized protein n=1 Tax=Cuscuta campestris TaxID=132261 RepID=A0A484KD93_9ASTE|nr:unnamed protein product [Cuscuta campestris]